MSNLVCDHASVGVIARNESGSILLVERARYPFGIAPPSGHLDGHSYPIACFKEFEEETGLRVKPLIPPRTIIVERPLKQYKCRRPGGDYHVWQIFEVQWDGNIEHNPEEVKSI